MIGESALNALKENPPTKEGSKTLAGIALRKKVLLFIRGYLS
jgi:hypothetical protein